MLDEKAIQQALHAHRVVPLAVPNPHGPLGLEQLAAVVARLAQSPVEAPDEGRIRRPISLSAQSWERLERLANSTMRGSAGPASVSEVAAAIIEQFLASTP